MIPPIINPTALEDALVLVNAAQEKIKRYADQGYGLPVGVRVWRNTEGLQVRLECHLRMFKNCQGKRLLTVKSAPLGHELWAMIADAGDAYRKKTGRL